jgi:hypothetical protein
MPIKAKIHADKALLVTGDGASVCVIFNNVSGANFKTVQEHRDYLDEMEFHFETQLEVGTTVITLSGNGQVVATCKVGDKMQITDGLRVLQATGATA